ncbi:zinc-dependent alcohol dehydrogenase family protein [Aspergillus ibericus CBS 121593]|uniref:NAD(P)-binding protein n=1 Tax=Aspergillus ibericus CBS 121593 TaxID=1448316 RepID=A0A395H867_9EURO|nr:NAD(P)-binding protein [Aspergillus ibericus CBS 121593]RAL03759.1 NAD(P)-binding protein [Aspergillus ibericus CBS 121593]
MARQWLLTGQEGFETSLQYQQDINIPSAHDLTPNELLVRMYAASLNYRDLMIASPANFNGRITPPLVPACDGAGLVEAVGLAVKEFCSGDRVVTHLAPKKVEVSGDDAPLGLVDTAPALGQGLHGTLRSHGVFSEYALVHAPKSLEWLPAATLTCTWTTAWNALFGLKGKEAGPGSWVLVQGATVIVTTSTEEKAARLKALGATHVISYRNSPTWGEEARRLTPNGRGFDFVIDVGGNQTLPQSLAAVRVDGIVLVVGMLGEDAASVPMYDALMHTCIVRGLLAGSRSQFREVIRFIDEKGIVPAMDEVVFELAEAKSAYRRLEEKRHFAKVVIQLGPSCV